MHRYFRVASRDLQRTAAIVLASLPFSLAHAVEIQTGNPDWTIRWDNTVKYSTGYRLKSPDAGLSSAATLCNPGGCLLPNILGQGDRNFDKGLTSNRLDLLTEIDIGTKRYGMRASGAAWYDSVYNQNGDDGKAFLPKTRDLHGRKGELLDAFIWAKAPLGDSGAQATGRLGRHTLIYGETLFFGGNGIANAQGPIDVVKLLSVPGSQFKEILRPVNQASAQVQVNPQLSVGGYVQLQWQRSVLPGAGSYFSNADLIGYGSGILSDAFGNQFGNGGNIEPDHRQTDQGGLQLRYKPSGTDLEFGFYAAKYDDKTPSNVYATIDPSAPGPAPLFKKYNQVFARGIKTVGASVSTSLGDFNIAGEASYRWNAPLVSNLTVVAPTPGGPVYLSDGATHVDAPGYAVGRTMHANVSAIGLLPPSAWWQGGSVIAELAWNRTLSVQENAASVASNSTRSATAFRMIFEPAYFQVIDNLDMTVPIGLGAGLSGRSSAVNQAGFGTSRGGDLSIGVKGTYQQNWQFGVSVTHYFGAQKAFLDAAGHNSYGQSFADRDFISAYLTRSF